MVELDLDLAALEAAARAVPDPELPVVTLGELGVVRGVAVAADGAVEVAITPTYVGCPATEAIAGDVRAAVVARLRADGVAVVGSLESAARLASGSAQAASADFAAGAHGVGLVEAHAAASGADRATDADAEGAPIATYVSGRAEPRAVASGADRATDVRAASPEPRAAGAALSDADAEPIATYVSGRAEPRAAASGGADRASDAAAANSSVNADAAAASSAIAEGAPAVEVRTRTVLSPAWSTNWISEEGRRKLAAHGIAPPSGRRAVAGGPVFVQFSASPAPRPPAGDTRVECPHCGSAETRLISAFGSTPCQSLRACRVCGEPFGAIKTL